MDTSLISQSIKFPGYGMFWVANSITSTLLGCNNRRLQEKACERNIAFQRELERAREITDNQKFQEEIAFKRRLTTLSREYRQEESMVSFQMQLQGIELQGFLNSCWPLDMQLPSILLGEMQQPISSSTLNVVLMHCPLLPVGKYGTFDPNETKLSSQIEYQIQKEDIPYMGDIKFRKDACVKPEINGGNSCIMNIHFLMSQLPTLVILPKYYEGKMTFKGAIWEPQSARPLIRNLFAVDYVPEMAKTDSKYLHEAIDLIHTSVSVIMGIVRDSYMLMTKGMKPSLSFWLNDDFHRKMKRIVLLNEPIYRFIQQSQNEMADALDMNSTAHLLECFSEQDIDSMRKMVENTYFKI